MITIPASRPTARLAQLHPVARSITRSPKPRGIHESLRQPDGVGVDTSPVRVQSTKVRSQDARREVRFARPGKHEKANVAHYPMQSFASGVRVPTYELVARRVVKRRRSPTEDGCRLLLPKGHVANRFPDKWSTAQVVEALNPPTPCGLLGSEDGSHDEWWNREGRRFERRRRSLATRRAWPHKPTAASFPTWGKRKLHQPPTFQSDE